MAKEKTWASVTDSPCACGYLERAANDPDNPISFNSRRGVYQFTYQEPQCDGPSMLVIFHCPFCGGVAPSAQPEFKFHAIASEEEERLLSLLKPLTSIEMVVDVLGPPTSDDFVREHGVEKGGQPPVFKYQRHLTYDDLSKVAQVWIKERTEGGIDFRLIGKLRQS